MSMATMCRMLACAAAVVLVLLPFSQAQVLPDVGLSATVLEGQETPTGNTVYGTPRTFEATIVQLGTGGAIQGNLTFFAGATPICTTKLNPTSLASATVDLNTLNPTFTIDLLNQVLLGNNVLPPGLLAPLNAVIGPIVALTGGVVDSANLGNILNALTLATLNNIAIQTAVIASCTTATIPVGNYAAVTVAYADLSVGGTTVTLRPLLDTPLLSPTATLALGAFAVTPAPDTVQGTNPAPTLPGATTPFVATVINTNAGSTLPPDGGTVTALLNGVPIGSGPITSTSGKTATFAFPITVPTTATPGTKTITLQYSGTPNFAPAASGDGTSPAGPTITVPELVTFNATPSPTAPPAGTPVTVTGTAITPSGAIPTGTVTLTVNGVPSGPFTIQPDGTFIGTITAPAQPSNGTPYPVTVTYAPASPAFAGPTPPYSFPLTVGPATGNVSAKVTPNPVAGTAPVTVSGAVTGTNGLPAVGTVDIKVDGTTVLPNVPIAADGTYTGTFPAPGAAGTYAVTATFNPAPGNSIASATSAPVPLSVTAATSTITQTVTPNPAPPGGAATVTGTVTNTNGSPTGGSVTVYLNGVPVGTGTVGSDGKFTVPFTAPTAPGSYNLLTTYTPTGAAAPTASFLTNFVVSSGNGGGTAPTNITISFGNGGTGFAFPNCLGSLTISVSASGSPSPTGNVTLAISGGKLGSSPVTLGTATFANGVATFNLESLKVKKELLDKFITHLTSFKKKLTLNDIRDYDLFPEGDFLLLPGDYTLAAIYGGDSVYGPSSGSAPFRVDPLCLLLALALRG